MTLPSTAYTHASGGAPIASRLSAKMSSAEKRHNTEVPGLCKVTVGYSSSAAGTSRGKSGDGEGSTFNCAAGFAGDSFVGIPAWPPSDNAAVFGVFFGNEACCPNGRRVAGGTMGEHCSPFTLNVTVAVTRRPSHVSTADSSSRQTRHPTVAPSVKAARVGFAGVHHCPATRIWPVVQRPQDPCQAPTSVLLGISSVESPMDKVVIIVCCNPTGPTDRGKTDSSRLRTSQCEKTVTRFTSFK